VRAYLAVWRLPSAPVLLLAGFAGRLPSAMVPLALLLMVQQRTGSYAVAGKHCEADTLIPRVALPEPRRGDVLAVPATGAYTLAMSSNYNLLPRPAAVLVGDGRARLIRRRESLDDLLALEVE